MTVCDRCGKSEGVETGIQVQLGVRGKVGSNELATADLCPTCRRDIADAVRAAVKATMEVKP